MSCGAGDMDPANWMAAFSHVPVPNLVMPGAHDSGAQDLNFLSTAPDWKAARGLLPLACCVVKPWSEAQGCDAAGQLLAGCRYFDLRIGIDDAVEEEGAAERYRLCHGYFSRGTLGDFLEDVRGFLDEHPTEAVFLEAKTVTSFADSVSMEQHHTLIAYMEELLGGKGAFVNKKNMMRPLGQLLSEGKQVFMVYQPGGWGHPGESPVDEHRDTMLPGYLMRSMWPNVCDPASLCDSLGQEIEEQGAPNHNKFLVLQCVMTPGANEILKGLLGCGFFDRSLLALARRAEPELQEFLEGIPESSLAHGAVIMLDWIEEQPDLIQWVLQRNHACHAPA